MIGRSDSNPVAIKGRPEADLVFVAAVINETMQLEKFTEDAGEQLKA